MSLPLVYWINRNNYLNILFSSLPSMSWPINVLFPRGFSIKILHALIISLMSDVCSTYLIIRLRVIALTMKLRSEVLMVAWSSCSGPWRWRQTLIRNIGNNLQEYLASKLIRPQSTNHEAPHDSLRSFAHPCHYLSSGSKYSQHLFSNILNHVHHSDLGKKLHIK